mmetsp:Transcript_71925/g.203117  ORF Transcript_71925/g.203117 Transcript_71925/m.203117 type:complete len:320 (+) Transcript_71925:432-1391(+)
MDLDSCKLNVTGVATAGITRPKAGIARSDRGPAGARPGPRGPGSSRPYASKAAPSILICDRRPATLHMPPPAPGAGAMHERSPPPPLRGAASSSPSRTTPRAAGGGGGLRDASVAKRSCSSSSMKVTRAVSGSNTAPTISTWGKLLLKASPSALSWIRTFSATGSSLFLAGLIFCMSMGRWPSSPAWSPQQAATAPHFVCPRTMTVFVPRCLHAYSSEASPSSSITFPATRTVKTSPASTSNTISTGTLESAHPSTAISGAWPLAIPSRWLVSPQPFCFSWPDTYRPFPSMSEATAAELGWSDGAMGVEQTRVCKTCRG